MNTHPASRLRPEFQSNRRPRRSRRPGFTLIETVLALVLGSMVLAGCLSVFLAMRSVETTFAARYERTSELDITHTIVTRAMLSMQMEEGETSLIQRQEDAEASDSEPESRDRIILETDPSVEPDSTGWIPQRLEVVCATPPAPPGLATGAAQWYTAESQSDSLDFSAMDGSQGVTRGVFELRPTGQRERIMQSLGLLGANDPIMDDIDPENPAYMDPTAPPDWTLWWRPILPAEGEQLLAGYGPLADTQGNPDEIRARLAGAVPLLRHIERCIWELYKGDEFITTHYGLTMTDLPAYAQFEVILTNSQYASWMFEVDWVLGEDPSTASGGPPGGDDTDGDPDADGGGPGGGPDDGSGGGQRPGMIDPDRTRVIDFRGDS